MQPLQNAEICDIAACHELVHDPMTMPGPINVSMIVAYTCTSIGCTALTYGNPLKLDTISPCSSAPNSRLLI